MSRKLRRGNPENIGMIDRHELDYLEHEYVELYLADLTDDIDCSPSTHQRLEARLMAIEKEVGKFIADDWSRKAEARAKKCGMASGAPYED